MRMIHQKAVAHFFNITYIDVSFHLGYYSCWRQMKFNKIHTQHILTHINANTNEGLFWSIKRAPWQPLENEQRGNNGVVF